MGFSKCRGFRRDQGQVRVSLTLGQRADKGLRERSVKGTGVDVNGLLMRSWI